MGHSVVNPPESTRKRSKSTQYNPAEDGNIFEWILEEARVLKKVLENQTVFKPVPKMRKL